MKTLEWDSIKAELKMIDQRLLPRRFEIVTLNNPLFVANAIRDMVVRGAPAIGASAAFGMALSARCSKAASLGELKADLRRDSAALLASRPTAVNLPWALSRIEKVIASAAGSPASLRAAVEAEAVRIAEEDISINRRMAEHGASLIQDGDTIIHHCNTGSLATVDWGTALGAIHMAHEQGKRVHVLVDETRPRLQGSRLTAWELQQYGIPYEIITDNMAGHFLRRGAANKVFFGADRVTANGDVANKVGSYMLALAAYANAVPVYSLFPTSTVDLSLPTGWEIEIEERGPDEVLDIQIHGEPVVPQGAGARNPAFDVTPAHLLTALVTENGVVYPPYSLNLPANVKLP
jgi:methylthioribose-1-phosphate isomerase